MLASASLVAQFALLTASAAPDLIPPPRETEWTGQLLSLPREVLIAAPPEWADQLKTHVWILDEVLQTKSNSRTILTVAAPTTAPTTAPATAPATTAPAVTIPPTTAPTSAPTTSAPAASAPAPAAPPEPTLRIHHTDDSFGPEGYQLTVSDKFATIDAASPAGVRNAFATIAQLIEQDSGQAAVLPTGRIHDSPSLAVRAVHIDLTCQHYSADYVCRLMRILARYKINAILMEYSDQFPFRAHAAINRPDAFTEQDIAAIRRTAAECGQEIIPFLQCLGHLEYVLHRPEYEPLGRAHRRYMLCPSAPASAPFACRLIDEILAQHPGLSRLHIGGDEAPPLDRDNPCPACAEYVKQHGQSALYVKHYKAVAEYCIQKGVTPLMWSDMILQHPEALADLPRQIAWVDWDYSTTANLTAHASHGARMDALDQLSPAYRQFFGEGVGLKDASQRGGLVAFGNTLGFSALGFGAFTAPAARCAGDQFNLPRFTLHMRNIQIACRQAAQFKLPGVIITSWSYRGAPHELCLPEYVCAAYGWNPAAAELEPLLAAFLRQRYGIADPALPKVLLDLSAVVPPTMLAGPKLDDARRAWLVNADAQLEQLKAAIRRQPEEDLRTYQTWLAQAERAATQWHAAAATSTRNQRELTHWELSLQHLCHRLRLLLPLAQMAAVAYAHAPATEPQLREWEQQIRALDPARDQLRRAWAELYQAIATPAFLPIDLEMRFDAEKAIVDTVLAAPKTPTTQPTSAPASAPTTAPASAPASAPATTSAPNSAPA